MIPLRSLSNLAPMIHSLRKEKASNEQYQHFAKLLLGTYQVELTNQPRASFSDTSLRMICKLLQSKKEEQALKGFVQRLLLVIYTAREWQKECASRSIPSAEVWFNPRKANNILAMEKEILALV